MPELRRFGYRPAPITSPCSSPVSRLGRTTTAPDRVSAVRSSGGRPGARRRRAVFYNALEYAVERKLLPRNPLAVVRVKSRKTADEADRRAEPRGRPVGQRLRPGMDQHADSRADA
jgi:hypothetical protein